MKIIVSQWKDLIQCGFRDGSSVSRTEPCSLLVVKAWNWGPLLKTIHDVSIAGPAELSQTTSIEVRMPEALLMGHTISRSSSTLDNSHSPENLESSHTYRTLGDTQGASATMQSKVWLQEMPPNYGPAPRGMNQRSSSHETNVIQTCSWRLCFQLCWWT